DILLSDSTAQVPELSDADMRFEDAVPLESELIEVSSAPELTESLESSEPAAFGTIEPATPDTDTSAGAPGPTLAPAGESRGLPEAVEPPAVQTNVSEDAR